MLFEDNSCIVLIQWVMSQSGCFFKFPYSIWHKAEFLVFFDHNEVFFWFCAFPSNCCTSQSLKKIKAFYEKLDIDYQLAHSLHSQSLGANSSPIPYLNGFLLLFHQVSAIIYPELGLCCPPYKITSFHPPAFSIFF